MTKEDIPSLYTLAVYYKRRTTKMLNNPWIIKHRVKATKKRLEGISRRFNVWKPFHKLSNASAEHLVISMVLIYIGSLFWYCFCGYIDILYASIYNSPTGLFQFIFILANAIAWSSAGFVLVIDAFAKWLVEVNDTTITYSDLEKRRIKKY